MKWVAAFAVSAYGYCNDRAGHKPFNPLLGETFECVRDDKGFKYIAEQVWNQGPNKFVDGGRQRQENGMFAAQIPLMSKFVDRSE